MSNKIDQAELLAEQEDMGLGLHEAPDRPQHAGNVAFTKEMMECMPDEEVPQEVKDKNKFQYKYEVKVKKVPKKLKNVAGLKEGLIGRVVEVLSDKAVMVDFWTKTSPAKFPMRSTYLGLHKTREQVEIEAGVVQKEPIKEVKQPIKEVNNKSALSKQEGGNHYKMFKIQPIEYALVNNLNMCQGNVVKYITRYKHKGGLEDLKKAIHSIELLIEYEGYNNE